jgi:hypothetical protein
MAGTKRGTSALLEVGTCINSGKPSLIALSKKLQGEMVCREHAAGTGFRRIS